MKDLVSRCPIEEVMQVISGRWPGLLIYYLKQGTKRFSDLRRDNPAISHRMLTLELRKLEDAGIVARTEFEGYPLRVEYDLTPAGLSSCRCLMRWAAGGMRRKRPQSGRHVAGPGDGIIAGRARYVSPPASPPPPSTA
jgi:DNA-binding HxlR family transcriptional regulator